MMTVEIAPGADQQGHGKGHDHPFEPALCIAPTLGLRTLRRCGKCGGEVIPGHLKAKQEQDDAPCDPESRQGNAEKGQKGQACKIEEGQKTKDEQGDEDGDKPRILVLHTGGGGGKQGHWSSGP